MFNVTIIRLRDIVKIVVILIFIYISSQFIFKNISIKNYLSQNIGFNFKDFSKLGINVESNIIKNISNNQEQEINEQTEEIEDDGIFSTKSVLQVGFNVFSFKELEQDLGQDDNIEVDLDNIQNVQEIAQTTEIIKDVSTEVVTKNPLPESFNREFNGIKIRNETSYDLTNETLNPDNLNIDPENIIIFHTHTCESYIETENYRTTDLNYSVARVGDELTSYLKNAGFNVNHNKTYHDYPSYNGSYSRSLNTVQNMLQSFSSDIIIDLHRDAIGSDENYAPLVKIGDDYCAQLMFVIGSDGGGLAHPNWNSNLKFAVKIQEKANELYPGLFKPIIFRNSRYNQHLGKAACIIEVGATGNTLEQTLASMKYLSNVMKETLK